MKKNKSVDKRVAQLKELEASRNPLNWDCISVDRVGRGKSSFLYQCGMGTNLLREKTNKKRHVVYNRTLPTAKKEKTRRALPTHFIVQRFASSPDPHRSKKHVPPLAAKARSRPRRGCRRTRRTWRRPSPATPPRSPPPTAPPHETQKTFTLAPPPPNPSGDGEY